MCVSVEMLSKYFAAKSSSEIHSRFTPQTRGDEGGVKVFFASLQVNIGVTLHES
jgi:hypothetical protein